jgi:S-formylglutathione hydrolase FrmB
MRFAVYVPPAAELGPVPVLYYLAGLTCTEETATIKAGAQAHASKHGLMLVMPDTSPMGGHGALTIALKNPGRYRSVSAFAPICAPTQCPWGEKAFRGYLGEDTGAWQDHDATCLVAGATFDGEILIDQGTEDQFLHEQLHPEKFSDACARAGQRLTLRMQQGYDHSYYFIQSFVGDHIAHHAATLNDR